MIAKVRIHKAYAQKVSVLPLAKHGRDLDVSREVIRRPLDSAPRRAEGWR